jgi:protein phosphatase
MKEEMQGRGSGKVRDFALYGETTGETDEFGLPIRYNWAAEYRGRAAVVYGHTPVPNPNGSTGRPTSTPAACSAASSPHCDGLSESSFPCLPLARTANRHAPSLPRPQTGFPSHHPADHDDLLDADDVLGKRIISTRLRSNVTIREENATAALEVMSRFAANPKWLIYLPPTMSPCETSKGRASGVSRLRLSRITGRRACQRSCASRSTWGPVPW